MPPCGFGTGRQCLLNLLHRLALGSQPELADRLLELLAELQEVLNEGPEKPNW